jgi:hypothetical protein
MYESDDDEEEAPPPPAPRPAAPVESAPPAPPAEPEPRDKIDAALEGLEAASPRIDAACGVLWRMRRRLDELDAAIAQADAKRQRRC